MRKCSRCGLEKDNCDFWKTCAFCKPCDLQYRREWRKKNKDKLRERRMVLWRRNHSRKCNKCGCDFVGKGIERIYCSTKCKIISSITKRKNGCWEWDGPLHPNGYAYTTNYEIGKKYHVHRVSYETFKAPIPPGMYVCHSCDNRKCCNPDHLWIGSAKDNMQDALKKGRLEHIKKMMPKGSDNGASKLTEDKVKQIKILIDSGEKIASIARKFDVSWTCIDRIKKGVGWRHVK